MCVWNIPDDDSLVAQPLTTHLHCPTLPHHSPLRIPVGSPHASPLLPTTIYWLHVKLQQWPTFYFVGTCYFGSHSPPAPHHPHYTTTPTSCTLLTTYMTLLSHSVQRCYIVALFVVRRYALLVWLLGAVIAFGVILWSCTLTFPLHLPHTYLLLDLRLFTIPSYAHHLTIYCVPTRAHCGPGWFVHAHCTCYDAVMMMMMMMMMMMIRYCYIPYCDFLLYVRYIQLVALLLWIAYIYY